LQIFDGCFEADHLVVAAAAESLIAAVVVITVAGSASWPGLAFEQGLR